jgi:hypothetical protein
MAGGGLWMSAMAMALALAGCGYTRAWAPRQFMPPMNFSEWFPTTVIVSEPPGARVEVNGAYVGTTPLSVVIPRPYETGWGGMRGGGRQVTWIGPVQVAVIPEDPTLRPQRTVLPADVPAPEHLAFDMRDLAPARIHPSDAIAGELPK